MTKSARVKSKWIGDWTNCDSSGNTEYLNDTCYQVHDTQHNRKRGQFVEVVYLRLRACQWHAKVKLGRTRTIFVDIDVSECANLSTSDLATE